jgi:hypothetical protein
MPGIPEAVRRQDEASDKAIEAAVQTATDTAGQTPPPQPAPATTGQEVVNPPAPQEANDETIPKAEYDRLMHSHDVLKGKYAAEVPRMAATIRELKKEITDLRTSITPPSAPAQSHASQSGSPQQGHLALLKEDEIKDLDKDALDLQARLARGVSREELGPVLAELREIRAKLSVAESKEHETEIAKKWNRLEALCQGARSLNDDPDFNAFLETTEEDSGLTWRELSNAAWERGDIRRTADAFIAFKRSKGLLDLSEDPKVAAQVRPERSAASMPGKTPAKKPSIRNSYIRKFYDSLRRGEYKGREKEAAQIEADIEQADAEGRIIND